MPGSRAALLVATDTYTDATFSRLRAPARDVEALAEVLQDPEIGGFTVDVLTNQPSHQIRLRLNEFFSRTTRNDLVLLYVSGHGVKNEAGRLHLATTDTQRSLLAATAVSAQFVREMIDNSPARKVVLWLDCCYAGAFPAGMIPKAEGRVDVIDQLTAQSGPGCAVMTASTHVQYAFEGNGSVRGKARPSVFTSVIVEGLRTGAADLNNDGEIDAAELYDYVFERVKQTTPNQTPTRNDQIAGNLYIAHSRRGLRLHPDIPAEIRHNLRSQRLAFRLTAVMELAELINGSEPELRAIARDTLRQLTTTQDRDVAEAASKALSPPLAPPAPVVESPAADLPVRIQLPTRGQRAGMGEVAKRSAYASGPIIGFGVALALNGVAPGPALFWVLTAVLFALVASVALGYLGFSVSRVIMDSSVTLHTSRFAQRAVFFCQRGRTLMALGGEVMLWETSTWRRVQLKDRPYINDSTATFSADNQHIVDTFSGDIRLIDGVNLSLIRRIPTRRDIEKVAASPDANAVAALYRVGPVEIWNTADRTRLATVKHRGSVRDAAFSHDGSMFATAGHGGVTLFTTEKWQRIRCLSNGTTCVAIAFSPVGDLLAGMGYDRVTVWLAGSGEFVTLLDIRPGLTKAIAFSPDGSMLAHTRRDYRIQLWDTATWQPTRTLTGHYHGVTSLAFSPDSRILASTSYDRTVKLWQVKT